MAKKHLNTRLLHFGVQKTCLWPVHYKLNTTHEGEIGLYGEAIVQNVVTIYKKTMYRFVSISSVGLVV